MLEEQLQVILSLSMVPDGSKEFLKWHDEKTASQDFFWEIERECKHFYEVQEALKLIKNHLGEALLSKSKYVRKLGKLIAVAERSREELKVEFDNHLRSAFNDSTNFTRPMYDFVKDKILIENTLGYKLNEL